MSEAFVDGDLPTLLAAGERAVFHGPPSSAVPDLERAVVLAQSEGRHAEVTAAVWLLGVALSAAGRYGGGPPRPRPRVGTAGGGGGRAGARGVAAPRAAPGGRAPPGAGRRPGGR